MTKNETTRTTSRARLSTLRPRTAECAVCGATIARQPFYAVAVCARCACPTIHAETTENEDEN